MSYNNGSHWGYQYPNNMPPTANPLMYRGNHQLLQNMNGMGTHPGQGFSGYPSQIVPNGTTQQMTTGQCQQFGSNLASQWQFGSATSANNGGDHLLYATPRQTMGQMAAHQQPHFQNLSQQYPGDALQQMDIQEAPLDQNLSQLYPGDALQQMNIQEAPLDQNLSQQYPGDALQQMDIQEAPLDQNLSQQFPANAPQQAFLPLNYPQNAPQEPQQAYTNIPPSAPLLQASGQQVAEAQYLPQPQHQPKSQDKPQQPKLTFEQRIAAFPPVPPPQPEPIQKQGRGRKKKWQRFWAPEDANDRVKAKYERLQTVDARVDLAQKKLDKNNDQSKVVHLQDMLLRNMEEREDVRTQCERLKQGLIAIERKLPDAEKEVKRTHEAWKESCQRVSEREAELMQANVRAVQDDNSEAAKKQKKWERESLQSTVNWRKNKWFALEDALESLSSALLAQYGDCAPGDSMVQGWLHVHRLGIYEEYSHFVHPGDSEINVWSRQNFSNPDPATWIISLPPHLRQQQAQHGQVGQPEHDQSAQQPPANHEPVAASVQMDHLPDADDVQMDFSDAQNGQGQQQPHIQEAPMIEGDREGLSDFTDEDALAAIEEFNRGLGHINPEEMFPIAQEGEAPPQIADYNPQQVQLPQENVSAVTHHEEAPAQIEPSNQEQAQPPQDDCRPYTDKEVADMFPPIDQEQQQPQQCETFEGTEDEGDPAQIEPSTQEQGQLPQEDYRELRDEEVAATLGPFDQEQQQPQQRETSAATHEKHLAWANWKADQQLLKQQEMLMKTPAGRTALRAGVDQKLKDLQQSQGLPVANEAPAPVVEEISPHQPHFLGLSVPFSVDPTDENTNMSADAAAAIDELLLGQHQEQADQARIPEEAQQQDGPQDQDAIKDEDSDEDTEGIDFEEVDLPPMPPTRTTLMPLFNA